MTATYPEWLMPYKTKGVYVSRRKGGYALYRGHSERVPGRRHPVFRYDEYLGMVTEADGLVPPSPSVRPGIGVYRYGLACLADHYCFNLQRWPKDMGLDSRLLYVRGVLRFEGRDCSEGYLGSWLSKMYPGLDLSRGLSEEEEAVLSRLTLQVRSKLELGLRGDFARALSLASDLYAVRVNGRWLLGDVPHGLGEIAASHGLDLGTAMTKRRED